PRVSIRARVCADAIAVAGADRVVTLDLHAPQIQGFFHIPVDDLYALPVLGKVIKRRKLRDLVVVSPDIGFAKQARKYASFLGASIAIADKQRKAHDERAEILEIIGEVQGKTALLVDDFTISAGTLVNAAEKLVERGARAVYAAVSHGVFSEGSMERLERSPIQSLLVTDSIETQPVVLSHKVEVVSVAPLFGEAIRRIHDKESISVLFPAKTTRSGSQASWPRFGSFWTLGGVRKYLLFVLSGAISGPRTKFVIRYRPNQVEDRVSTADPNHPGEYVESL